MNLLQYTGKIKMFLMLTMSCRLSFAVSKYQCDPNGPSVTKSEKFGVGTNLGGWLVLEPW